MLLPSAAARRLLALLALAGMAAPAGAATASSVLEDIKDTAIATGTWIQLQAGRIWSGDMDAIRDASFSFAGVVALFGIWLLVRPPWRVSTESVIALPDEQGIMETADTAAVGVEQVEPEPPKVLLLDAVAAAKAQFEISENDRKRSR